MTEDEGRRPRWAESSLEKLENTREDIETIRKEGQKEIKSGLVKVNFANQLDREASYIYQVLNRSQSSGTWSDEIVQSTGVLLGGTVDYLRQETSRLAGLAIASNVASEKPNTQFIKAVYSTDAPSASSVFLAASMENRLISLDPEENSKITVLPEKLSSRDTVFLELMGTIQEFDPRFGAMLKGSEEALEARTTDHLSQAAHSMRDLFQQLIESLAPRKAVESQPWFIPTEGAPGGVSRSSRLRFILYRSGEAVDENLIEQYDRSANTAKEALDLCIARAHDHDQSLTALEVQYAIDQARYALLNVLKQRSS